MLLMRLVMNFGGWIIKYLKNGCKFSKAPAVPTMNIATAICKIACADKDNSNKEPAQPSNKPKIV